MNQSREEYAVAAHWAEYRKVIGDKLSRIEVGENWIRFGSAREAAITGGQIRLRDLEADEIVSEPEVQIMRRWISLDGGGETATRSPWESVMTLGPEPQQQALG